MPFLFVDYDQGAGGEFFCANLSRSAQCQLLESTLYTNGRTKIHDVFAQEFLKLRPAVKFTSSHPTLFDIVPTHRYTPVAEQLLGEIRSIRISNPKDDNLWKFLKYQQINKVLLAPVSTGKHFIGELKDWVSGSRNTEWVKKIKRGTDGLSMILLSKGLDPSESNKQDYIKWLFANKLPDPVYRYDLVIPYEDLFFNPESIVTNIKNVFGIEIADNWLNQYKKNYDAYLTAT